jgi:hypothetical protein
LGACQEGLQEVRGQLSALQLVGLEHITQNDLADSNSEECRQASIEYVQEAEKLKKNRSLSVFWYGADIPFIKMAYRRMILGLVIFSSLALTIAYAAVEDYPDDVKKLVILKIMTAGAAALKLALHVGLFRLSGNADRWARHSRSFVVAEGFHCAVIKLVECGLICHIVNGKLPTTWDGKYCLVAQGLAEGLMAVAAGMAPKRCRPAGQQGI